MKRLAWVLLCLAAVLAAGCGSSEKGGEMSSGHATEIKDAQGAQAALGKQVRFTGTAEEAKLAPIVMSDALQIYCRDLDRWPEGVRNTRVTVTGRLEREEHTVHVAPDGAISQGMEGAIWVLRNATWERAKQ